MTRKRAAVDTGEYLAFTRRVIRAAGQRVSVDDPELLWELLAVAREIDAAIGEAIRGMRASGATWQDIGVATGTSRQAAWEKWGKGA